MMSTSSVSGKILYRKKGVQYVKSGEHGHQIYIHKFWWDNLENVIEW